MAGNVRVWDLRSCKTVVIPDGTEKIGNYWFYGSMIESVEIPAYVKEIGTETFYNCKNLKRTIFTEGSLLEIIGAGCFRSSGVEELTLPGTLREIGNSAFSECDDL